MTLFNFFHETEADSAYDKGPIQYFDAYRLTNKGGASYHHFSIRCIHTYIYIYIYVIKVPSLNQRKFCLEHNLLTLFDMGFFEPSVFFLGGGDEGPHHSFVLLL